MPRVGILGVWQETNTYSARLTEWASFESLELLSGDAIIARHFGTASVIGGFLEAKGIEFVPLFSASAWPAGPASANVADRILRSVRAQVEAAGSLDGVLLNLHGAMVCESHDDMDADVAEAIRDIVGGGVPMAAVLDFHGNPSSRLVQACNIVIPYDTYPHVDMMDRGLEAAELLKGALSGKRIKTLLRKLPIFASPLAQTTARGPVAELQTIFREFSSDLDARPGVFGGFAYSDTSRAGVSLTLSISEPDESRGNELLDRMVQETLKRESRFFVSALPPREAVQAALKTTSGPVILIDVADNIGGGSLGDGTALLEELLYNSDGHAVITLADAEAVSACVEAGIGGWVTADMGGKLDPRFGAPVRVVGRVILLGSGDYVSHGAYMTGQSFSMGTSAVVEVASNKVVITSRAVPPFHIEQLTCLGIDPARARIITVKGAVAWESAYAGIARQAIPVDTPGVCPVDPRVLRRTTNSAVL